MTRTEPDRGERARGPVISRNAMLSLLAGAWLLLGAWPHEARALMLYAAGDVAQCGNRPATASAAAATARLIPAHSHVAVLGDIAYPLGDRATLERCYGPTWGAFIEHTYPVPGNHDYVSGSPADYVAYFGAVAPNPLRYRAALGDWWFIGLDSNVKGPELEAQLAWLRDELASIRGDGRCIVAAWHHPLYSTGLHSGDGEPMRPVWEALAQAGAAIVLNGHEHFYESFRPKDASGGDVAAGLREFVVGTGGARLADVSLAPWQHRAYARRHGVLELNLQPGSYRWRFISVDGRALDHGESGCGAAPQPR